MRTHILTNYLVSHQDASSVVPCRLRGRRWEGATWPRVKAQPRVWESSAGRADPSVFI